MLQSGCSARIVCDPWPVRQATVSASPDTGVIKGLSATPSPLRDTSRSVSVVLLELLHAGIVLHRRHHGRNMPKQAPHDAALPQGVARDLVRIELGPLDRPAEQSPVVGCVNFLPPRAVLLEQERCIVRPIAPGALERRSELLRDRHRPVSNLLLAVPLRG
jgi:hypothetical protein